MKLVADAVRDVLLYLENNLEMVVENNRPKPSSISNIILADVLTPSQYYSKEEVIYAIQQLYDNDMINIHTSDGQQKQWLKGDIYDITWSGHELLNNIRSQAVWEAVKGKACKLGIMSIDTLSFLSSTIVRAIVSDPQLINEIVESVK